MRYLLKKFKNDTHTKQSKQLHITRQTTTLEKLWLEKFSLNAFAHERICHLIVRKSNALFAGTLCAMHGSVES
jgi:hypothetical protein